MTRSRAQRACPRDERGTITLWLLGLCLLLFALGGISLDLWRGFSARRSLAATADAAALAGASAVDEDAYRASGALTLDPAQAEARARAHAAHQLDRSAFRSLSIDVESDVVTVELQGEVGFTLLGILGPGGALPIHVTATATPRRAG